jgi:hypothetical protein
LTYLGFITEGKLAAVLITPSLGVPNWPVIYIINTAPPGVTTPMSRKYLTIKDRGDTKPTLNHAPKPLGIAAMREKVRLRLLGLLAKWTKTTIIPTSFLKMIRRP